MLEVDCGIFLLWPYDGDGHVEIAQMAEVADEHGILTSMRRTGHAFEGTVAGAHVWRADVGDGLVDVFVPLGPWHLSALTLARGSRGLGQGRQEAWNCETNIRE